jgi:phosphoribosylformimino-5-aminoimidazole carboxamide ribotide isomerase
MLIPSIDLKNGQVVQLVQGRDLALASDDVFAWVRRFAGFPKVQLIDLDGALGSGANDFLVRRICRVLPCRVGGGIRTVERARNVLAAGAKAVIVGSSLFRDGAPDLEFATALAEAVGTAQVIAAVDSLQGRVVIRGWRERTSLTTIEAVRALEPFCGEFLYTHVDAEGLMNGTDMNAIRAVREATSRRLTAAGGITTQAEIDALHAIGVDAVVGMAIYTGALAFAPPAGTPQP